MTAPPFTIARSEFILGGQKSGTSRRAEWLTRQWLDAHPSHRAVLIATAKPWDEEMRQPIARHRADRVQRAAGMVTVEEPLQLAQAIGWHSAPDTLVVVDRLTLWLTYFLMPAAPEVGEFSVSNRPLALVELAQVAPLLIAIEQSKGPLVLVGNEIVLGVIPLGAQVRAFVDALGSTKKFLPPASASRWWPQACL